MFCCYFFLFFAGFIIYFSKIHTSFVGVFDVFYALFRRCANDNENEEDERVMSGRRPLIWGEREAVLYLGEYSCIYGTV
jgi:hypothetical protein